MRGFRTFSAFLLLAGFFVGELQAQEPTGERRAHARERWESMSEQEQALFRERFDRLRKMPPNEREAMVERAAELERRKREQFEELSPELKRRLATLSDERREEILREFFSERERIRGMRMREHMPPEFLERIESLPPEERRVAMREFRHEMRESAGERMLGHIRRELEYDPEQMRELSELPDSERRRTMLELKREQIRGHVKTRGLPRGVSEEDWKELDALSFEEFFARWGHRREGRFRSGDRDALPPRGEGHPPRPDRGPRDIHGPGAGRREDRRPRFGGSARPIDEPKFIDEVFRLAHPSLEDLLEHAEVPARQRRLAVAETIRERCLEYLEANPVFEAAELERLRALSGSEFLGEIRSLLAHARGPRWERSKRSEAARVPRSHPPR